MVKLHQRLPLAQDLDVLSSETSQGPTPQAGTAPVTSAQAEQIVAELKTIE
ncbi:MAG TPA: hypothetical protein VEZ50_12080 [Nodosilinea sp.]|nr:hypothetical protein [Nodosilinea sp.]